MSGSTKITENYTWMNEHNNVQRQGVKRYQTYNDTAGNSWKGGLQQIQAMLKTALEKRDRVRSYGGRWSLSDAAASNTYVHDSKPLTFFAPVNPAKIKGAAIFADDARPLSERLFFVQSGVQVMQLNNVLEKRGLALATTGASNGQTLGGAISTGTHGSALKVGAMQEYVRAIHLVTSDEKHYFIQPESGTVLDPSFAGVLGAESLVDDDIFYSTLVSFGAFGVIHGYVIEAVSLYMLRTHCEKRSFDDLVSVFSALESFDAKNDSSLCGCLGGFGMPDLDGLHHVDIVVNPHTPADNAYLRVMEKLPFDKSKLSPAPAALQTRVGDDIIAMIGRVSDFAGDLVPYITNMLFGSFADVQHGYTQVPRNIFGDSTIYKTKRGSNSLELGVPVTSSLQATRIVMRKAHEAKIPGVLGIRFLKPTKATLGFTRYAPLTCTIEVPAVNTESTRQGYADICAALDVAGIPFTLHWGQEGDYSPYRLDKMYGDAVDTWKAARNTLLPDAAQKYIFTNDFMKRCGLAEPEPVNEGDMI